MKKCIFLGVCLLSIFLAISSVSAIDNQTNDGIASLDDFKENNLENTQNIENSNEDSENYQSNYSYVPQEFWESGEYLNFSYSTIYIYHTISTVDKINMSGEISAQNDITNVNVYEKDKLNPDFTVTVVNRTGDGNGTIIVNANPNVAGKIALSFLKYDLFDLTNGTWMYNFNNLSKGNHYFSLYYTGDEIFSAVRYSYLFVPIQSFYTEIIQKSDIKMYYRDGNRFSTILKDDLGRPFVGKEVCITINGVTYYRLTDENGSVSLNLNLEPGNYVINATYWGIKQLIAGNSSLTNLTILPTITGEDLVKIYKNDTQYYVNVFDKQGNPLKNTNVTFNINGVFYTRTSNDDGIAKLNINLNPGNYIITAQFNDSEKISNKITVIPTVLSKDLVKVYKNKTQFYIQTTDKQGKALANVSLKMNINGVFYTRTTDKDGMAKLNINLNQGKYIITTENLNDSCVVSNCIEVTSYLYSHDMVKYYKNASKYEVKLVDDSYNPLANKEVAITINNQKYIRTTDDNGVAKLAINLLPGEYEVVAINEEYNLKAVNTIKVLPTMLVPEKLSLSVHKWINFPVTILDGQGNPYANQTVVYHFDGKTDSAITNSDGIAGLGNFLPVDNNDHLVTVSYDGYSVSRMVRMMG